MNVCELVYVCRYVSICVNIYMYVVHIVVVCECMPAYMLKCCMYA